MAHVPGLEARTMHQSAHSGDIGSHKTDPQQRETDQDDQSFFLDHQAVSVSHGSDPKLMF